MLIKRIAATLPFMGWLQDSVVAGSNRTTVGGGNARNPRPPTDEELQLFALRKAHHDLEVIWAASHSRDASLNFRFVAELHCAQDAFLNSELERCSALGVTSGYREAHASQPVNFLVVLLEIYHELLTSADAGDASRADSGRSIAMYAADAARMLALFSWVRSEDAPPIVWKVLATVFSQYWKPPSGNGAEPQPKPGDPVEKINTSLIRTILLVLADPFAIQPDEIVSADRLIAHHADKVSLNDGFSEDAFAFDIAAGGPCAGGKLDGDARKFVTMLSLHRIAADVMEHPDCGESGRQPEGPWSAWVETVSLPKLLARRWMAFPLHRHSFRTEFFTGGRLVCGADSLIQAERLHWGPKCHPHMESQHVGRDCILMDYSEGGCRVKLQITNYLKLSPGTLVGVEFPSLRQRAVGVVSWIKRVEDRHSEVGIRFLPYDVEPVPLKLHPARWEGGRSVDFGLLSLDEVGKLMRDKAEILLPRQRLPAEAIEMIRSVNSGIDFHIKEVTEVGQDFVRVRVNAVTGN